MKREQVDLNLLVALDALLREQSVTRAARRLSVGQPAMSASLGRLRRMFSDPLLVRSGHRLLPTPLARSLVLPLRSLLDEVEDLLSLRPDFDPSTAVRSFTVMATDYVTLVLLSHVVSSLGTPAPGVQVRIRPLAGSYQEDLEHHQTDLLILPREVDPRVARFPHRTLFSERFVCVTWSGNREIGSTMTPDTFRRLPHLTCAPDPLPSLAELALKDLGVDRDVEMTTQSFVMAPFLVRGTRLVAVVHERVARDLAGAAGARTWELPFDLQPVTEVMYWHPRSEADAGHRWLRDRIAAAAANV
ncbi:MAG: LysR family transcriptional regulator [Acidimicrobiales bacterium]